MVPVVKVMSPRALRVAELVDVMTPVWVMEPPVELTLRTGAVVVFRAMLPPLESVTVRVVVEVRAPVVIVPVAAGADRVSVEFVEIVPVVSVPVLAVKLSAEDVVVAEALIVPALTATALPKLFDWEGRAAPVRLPPALTVPAEVSE